MLPRYLLVTPAWYDQGWWRINDDAIYSCSVHEREEVMSLTLGLLNLDFLAQLGDINTDTGIVRLIIRDCSSNLYVGMRVVEMF